MNIEKKEYYEVNLPPYLQHDLDAMKEGKYPYDCLWCEMQPIQMVIFRKIMHGT